MARQLRHEYEGGWYHVMSRGFQRQVIFRDDEERLHFLGLLAEMVSRYNVILHAYVLMANHYHLLIETPEANASKALQWLNVSYGVWFNRRHARSGAVFQARYKSVLVEGQGDWGLACSAYIHLNPVRIRAMGLDKAGRARMNAGLAPEPAPEQRKEWLGQLRAHEWSSYPAYAGRVKAPAWLTCGTLLGRVASKDPHAAYRRYIAERLGSPDDGGLSISGALVLGGDAFKEWARRSLLGSHPGDTGNALRWRRLLPFERVMACMEEFKGEKWESFVNRRGDWGRDMALYNGRLQCGLTLGELGAFAGMRQDAVSRCVARFAQKLSRQPSLARRQKEFCKILAQWRRE